MGQIHESLDYPISELHINKDFLEVDELIKDIESSGGNKWTIALYTDKLSSWKSRWKRPPSAYAARPLISLRSSNDKLLAEGSVKVANSLSEMDEVVDIVSGLHGPMNSDRDVEGNLIVPCSQELLVISPLGQLLSRITHKKFNDLHCVSVIPESGNILVTSSGAGKILEVDLSDGKVVWEWDADEHVISSSKGPHASKQLREEYFGKDVDYRDLLIETGAQITHINTAQPLGDHQIGTTFFHQGEAIVIDKNSGSCSVVLGGLKKPHGFQKFMYQEKPAWTITDTGNGVVRVINGEFQPILNILGFFDNHPNDEISWLHTTYTYGIFLMALDQTMSQIILMDPTTRRKQTIQHSKEWKVSYLGRD